MKKIIIYTSGGGSGHISVSKALKTYLEKDYDNVTSFIFDDVLKPMDLMSTLTFQKYSGEDFYNYFVSKKYYTILNMLLRIGLWYFRIRKKRVFQLINEHIKKQKPDLVISLVPIINNMILDVAKQHNLPFLLIPTDLDATTFIYGIKNPDYSKFHIALTFEDKDILQTIKSAHIPQNQISITGAVLRPDFFEQKNKTKLKELLYIVPDIPIVMVLMGGMGSTEIIKFAKNLATLPIPAHLLLCLGINEKVRKKIQNLVFPSHITYSLIGFTERISDLMAITDILITKSGSVSVCEAIYMQVPMLLDAISTILLWERFNHDFITKHQFGDIIKQYDEIVPKVTKLLSDKKQLQCIKYNLTSYEKKHGGEEIKKLVTRLIR